MAPKQRMLWCMALALLLTGFLLAPGPNFAVIARASEVELHTSWLNRTLTGSEPERSATTSGINRAGQWEGMHQRHTFSQNTSMNLGESDPALRAGEPFARQQPHTPHPFDQAGRILKVPKDFRSIQAAIEAASHGDGILVDAGTYRENINFLGKNIVITSAAGPSLTVIDGGLSGHVVVFRGGENQSAVLDGFTLTNGLAVDPYPYGGAVVIEHSSPTLLRLDIVNNGAFIKGGGVYITGESAQPWIDECRISGNMAMYNGGGVAIANRAAPTITSSMISRNLSESGSGIVVMGAAKAIVTGNSIKDNVVGFNFGVEHVRDFLLGIDVTARSSHPAFPAGILLTQNSGGLIADNVIMGNDGGGIGVLTGSAPTIQRNAIQANGNFDSGAITGGIMVAQGANPVFSDNIVKDNIGPALWIDDHSTLNQTRSASALMAENTIAGAIVLWPIAVPQPAVTAMPRTRRVPDEYPTIQQAIAEAEHGDTVVVSPGLYQEHIQFMGKAITLRSEDPDDPRVVAATTITGRSDGNAVLMFTQGETRQSIVEGFTLRNTYDSVIEVYSASPTIRKNVIAGPGGSGILMNHPYAPQFPPSFTFLSPYTVWGAETAPLIEDNTISHCARGGIYMYYATPVIRRNLITTNHGNEGGIWGWYSHPTVLDNIIEGNSAMYGGGLYFENLCNPIIKDNQIRGNRADLGGGIYIDTPSFGRIEANYFLHNESTAGPGSALAIGFGAQPTVVNNVIAQNIREAVFVSGGSRPTFIHNTLADNFKTDQGVQYPVGLFIMDNAGARVINTIFYNSNINFFGEDAELEMTYSLTYGEGIGLWPGTGNISDNPQFVSPSDYRLMPASPCIDAGTPTAVPEDIAGTARPQGAAPDMGAYEQ